MPRVLLFGTGAIGGLYASVLCKSRSVELTAVCRSNYDAITREGLRIDSEIFGQLTVHPDRVIRSCAEAASSGPYDFVVVTAKVLPGIAKTIQPAIAEQTTIVLIQNGIFIEEEYAELYPGRSIVSCSVNAPVQQVEPGKIRHSGRERLIVGAYPKDSLPARQKAEEISRLFKEGGATTSVDEDIQDRRWEKVAGNAALNPTCALTRLPDAHYLDGGKALDYTSEQLSRDLMDEISLIAQAVGHTKEPVERAKKMILDLSLSRPLDDPFTPSMLQDVRSGGRLEVEAILGNPVRKARELGVAVPRLEMMYVLTKCLDRAMAQGM